MNNLEILEAKLQRIMDDVNDVNSELIRNYASVGMKNLNLAHSELHSVKLKVRALKKALK